MTKIAFFSFLFVITSYNLSAQLCPDCDEREDIQYLPRFWEDPDGILHEPENINEPDKVGTWIFFKALDDNQREIIFTRDVQCVQGLDGRNRSSDSNDILLFPNPVNDLLTITHHFSECHLAIFDVRGVAMHQNANLKSKTIKVNTSDYSSGIYLVQIIADQEKINKFFVVE